MHHLYHKIAHILATINIQLDTVSLFSEHFCYYSYACLYVPNNSRFLELAQLKANQDDDSSVIQYQVCYNIEHRNVYLPE